MASEIRNVQSLTTGDFVDFEVLHSGDWKKAQISRTALAVLGGPDKTDEHVFDSEGGRITTAAQSRAMTTLAGEKIKIDSGDFQ